MAVLKSSPNNMCWIPFQTCRLAALILGGFEMQQIDSIGEEGGWGGSGVTISGLLVIFQKKCA